MDRKAKTKLALHTVDTQACPKGYFIKDTYQHGKLALTNNQVSGEEYWSSDRIDLAREYQYSVYDLAASLVKQQKLSSVIDVGCGVGVKLESIQKVSPEATIVGLDQPESVEVCKRINNFGNWIGDDFDNPGEAVRGLAPADLVICSDVIEHVEYPERLIEFLRSKMTSSSTLILSTPERDVLRGKANARSPKREHIREWNKSEMTEFLRFMGLSVIDWQLHFPVRPSFSKIYLTEVWRQWRQLRSVRYNQIFVLKRAS